MKKVPAIIVTSALPYSNGPIHIGHLVEYIQTDIFVRFLRLIGKDVIYACADDTHGTAIEIKAAELKITPEQLIARVSKEHQEDFARYHIQFDSYYSTNSPENKKLADHIFSKCKEKGYIYQKEVELLYDEKVGRFLPDRYVRGECPKCGAKDQYGDVCESCGSTHSPRELINPRSTLSGSVPVIRTSSHYFFRLSALSGTLKQWLEGNNNLQSEIKNYILNWIKDGLQDWDITRDGPYFGFKIAGEEDKYYYVWLDAPIGYLSSVAHYLGDTEKALHAWNGADVIHFIGKDIIYFHFLFWPAMLLAADIRLPSTIVVHGFLTVNGEKMSKSRGTYYTAREFAEQHRPEYLRYFYAGFLSRKLGDVDLSFTELERVINGELIGNIANYCYRVLDFSAKNYKGQIKRCDTLPEIEQSLMKNFTDIHDAYETYDFKRVITILNEVAAVGNKHFQEHEPWKRITTEREKVEAVLGFNLQLIRNMSILISPILPEYSKAIQRQLGLDQLSWNNLDFQTRHFTLDQPSIILKKIEVNKQQKKFRLNLRVGKVLEARAHPDAEKLIIMQVDLGTEKRQIVAGIRKHYSPESMIGKHIVVVANLKSAKLRGELSQGMLLAGCTPDESKVVIVEAPNSSPGDNVSYENLEASPELISFDEFGTFSITVKDHRVHIDGHKLATKREEIICPVDDGARVR